MRKSLYRCAIMGSLMVWIVGCGAGISRQVRSQVTYSGTFTQLQQNPEQQIGATVILGGRIIKTEVRDNGTDLVVLQLNLDSSDRPKNDDQSKGRFLILSAQFLDPALYPDGTLITVVGKVTGSQEKLIGQMPYRYPAIDPLEIKKWPKQTDQSPRFHIGIGLGKTF